MTDRRNLKTETLIESKFIALLQEKELAAITVSEIIRRCDISRGTFYLHYRDTYDLYERIVQQVTAELNVIFSAAYPKNDEATTNDDGFMLLVHQLITYLTEHQTTLNAIVSNQDGQDLVTDLRTMFTQKMLSLIDVDVTDPAAHTGISFCISGITGVLSDWLDQRMALSEVQLEKQIRVSLAAIGR